MNFFLIILWSLLDLFINKRLKEFSKVAISQLDVSEEDRNTDLDTISICFYIYLTVWLFTIAIWVFSYKVPKFAYALHPLAIIQIFPLYVMIEYKR
jgi:hypothetical protein